MSYTMAIYGYSHCFSQISSDQLVGWLFARYQSIRTVWLMQSASWYRKYQCIYGYIQPNNRCGVCSTIMYLCLIIDSNCLAQYKLALSSHSLLLLLLLPYWRYENWLVGSITPCSLSVCTEHSSSFMKIFRAGVQQAIPLHWQIENCPRCSLRGRRTRIVV